VKSLYVRNINLDCRAEVIAEHCQQRGVEVLYCSIAASKYFGTACAKVVITEDDADKTEDEEFWPLDLRHTVRPWRVKGEGEFVEESPEAANASASDV